MAATPDIDIYQEFLGGNPDGITSIIRFWRGPLIVWGLRFLDDGEAVEEAVADTFIALVARIEPFDDEEHLRAWLHSTVRNKCWTARSKQQRRLQQVVPLEEDAEYSSDLTADQSLDIKDYEIWIREVIRLTLKRMEKMPKRRREDCYAHIFQGKSYQQIADMRGRSRPTIAKNVEIGLEAIRKYLKEKGFNF